MAHPAHNSLITSVFHASYACMNWGLSSNSIYSAARDLIVENDHAGFGGYVQDVTGAMMLVTSPALVPARVVVGVGSGLALGMLLLPLGLIIPERA